MLILLLIHEIRISGPGRRVPDNTPGLPVPQCRKQRRICGIDPLITLRTNGQECRQPNAEDIR